MRADVAGASSNENAHAHSLPTLAQKRTETNARSTRQCIPHPTPRAPGTPVYTGTTTPPRPLARQSTPKSGGFYTPTPYHWRMNPPGQRYDKPALDENELIERYIERGLIITDRNRAARYLRHIGYYRLSPYLTLSRTTSPPTRLQRHHRPSAPTTDVSGTDSSVCIQSSLEARPPAGSPIAAPLIPAAQEP